MVFRATIQIDKDLWGAFLEKARHNGSSASQIIRQAIESYVGDDPVQQPIQQPARTDTASDLENRVTELEAILEKFFSAYREDKERQESINQVIRDELGFRTSIESEPIQQPVQQPVQTHLSLEELGLNLDLEDEPMGDSLEIFSPVPEENLPDSDSDQVETISPVPEEKFPDPDSDQRQVARLVTQYLAAQKKGKCYIQWLIANHPDSPEAKKHLDKVIKQLPHAERSRLIPLLPHAFGRFPVCMIIYEVYEGETRFWTGRAWDKDWKKARFYEDLAPTGRAVSRLKSQQETPVFSGNLSNLIEKGVISYV